VKIERKTYHLALCLNHRGRFARITESGRVQQRIAIVIPSGGLADLERILARMIQADAEQPEPPTGTA